MAKRTVKRPTKLVRIHEDVAVLADQLSGVFKEKTPDFVSNILRPILQGEYAERATEILRQQSAAPDPPPDRKKGKT